jgi:hypothetical protein
MLMVFARWSPAGYCVSQSVLVPVCIPTVDDDVECRGCHIHLESREPKLDFVALVETFVQGRLSFTFVRPDLDSYRAGILYKGRNMIISRTSSERSSRPPPHPTRHRLPSSLPPALRLPSQVADQRLTNMASASSQTHLFA